MPDWLRHLRAYLTLSPRALFVLAAGAWIVSLLPAKLWQYFGLLVIWGQWRPWAFLVALVASVLLLAGGVFDLAKQDPLGFTAALKLWRSKRMEAGIMEGTSRVEREVLAKYVAEDTTTLAFEIRDGVVNGLVGKGVLFRSSSLTNPMSYDLDTNIQPWAWEYVKKHAGLLKGIKPTKGGRHQIHL